MPVFKERVHILEAERTHLTLDRGQDDLHLLRQRLILQLHFADRITFLDLELPHACLEYILDLLRNGHLRLIFRRYLPWWHILVLKVEVLVIVDADCVAPY